MTKTKITLDDLCVRVARKISEKTESWGGGFVLVGRGLLADYEIKDFLLSPDGRELMEQEADKLGWCEFRWTGIFWFFDKHPNSGSDWIAGHHTDKHIACLYAFAQLVKVYDPETEEVVDE